MIDGNSGVIKYVIQHMFWWLTCIILKACEGTLRNHAVRSRNGSTTRAMPSAMAADDCHIRQASMLMFTTGSCYSQCQSLCLIIKTKRHKLPAGLQGCSKASAADLIKVFALARLTLAVLHLSCCNTHIGCCMQAV